MIWVNYRIYGHVYLLAFSTSISHQNLRCACFISAGKSEDNGRICWPQEDMMQSTINHEVI